LQAKFRHLEGDVVNTVADRQFVGKCAPACAHIKPRLVSSAYGRKCAGQIAGFDEGNIRLEFNSLAAHKWHCAGTQCEYHGIVRVFIRQWLRGAYAEIVEI
jgi:hypothetical protein